MKILNNKNLMHIFLLFYIVVAMIEVIAEFFNDKTLIYIFKPLLMPTLIGYYIYKSKKINFFYIVSLFFSWIATVLSIENIINYLITASIFFFIYRLILIYIILKLIKKPRTQNLLVGFIPFIFIYCTTCILTFEDFGDGLIMFSIHGIFITLLGGLSLANYMSNMSKTNLILLLSMIFFAISQFMFVLKIYSEYIYYLHSLSMLFFIFAQYLLTNFIYLKERPKSKYEFVRHINEL